MKEQRVVLRADASKQIGYGHFIRSLALAGYLKEDFDCWFASYNSDLNTLSRYQLTEIFKVASPFSVSGNTLHEFDEAFLEQLHPTDVVVLDNYYFTTEYQRKIKEKGCKLVCIDDMHDRHMVCDLLFTPSPLTRNDFSLEDYTEFYGGVEWAFLREPFFTPMPVRNITSEIKSVVIAMGGADAFNLTDKFIKIVHSLLPHARINAICGESVTINEESRGIATIHQRLSAQEMVDLFDMVDVGIFPASTITIEAFSRKLPVIAGYYADNQRAFYEGGIQCNYFAPLGCMLDDSESISHRMTEILQNHRLLPVVIDFRSSKRNYLNLFNRLKEK